MPCDYGDYPANWPEIRERIRARSQDRCEWCGVRNRQYRLGHRGRFTRVVLTVAHLDHDLSNNDGMDRGRHCLPLGQANLVHLCQRCHLGHDAKQHASTRRKNQDEAAGQGVLF